MYLAFSGLVFIVRLVTMNCGFEFLNYVKRILCVWAKSVFIKCEEGYRIVEILMGGNFDGFDT